MKKLNDEDIQAYFQAGNSGFWKVESEEGKKSSGEPITATEPAIKG